MKIQVLASFILVVLVNGCNEPPVYMVAVDCRSPLPQLVAKAGLMEGNDSLGETGAVLQDITWTHYCPPRPFVDIAIWAPEHVRSMVGAKPGTTDVISALRQRGWQPVDIRGLLSLCALPRDGAGEESRCDHLDLVALGSPTTCRRGLCYPAITWRDSYPSPRRLVLESNPDLSPVRYWNYWYLPTIRLEADENEE